MMALADLPPVFRSHLTIHPATGCWIWHGAVSPSGHGVFRIYGKTVMAHRYAFILLVGSIPRDTILRHRCHCAQCCNPAHVTLGSHTDNVADRVAAGRSAHGESHGRHKLTIDQVANIRAWHSRGLATIAELARLHGVTPRAVRFIIRGEHWRDVPNEIRQ